MKLIKKMVWQIEHQKKLFNGIKDNYDGAKNLYIALDDAIEKTEKVQNPTDKLLIAAEFFSIINSVIAFVTTTTTLISDYKKHYYNFYYSLMMYIIINTVMIASLSLVSEYLDNRNCEIKEKLENIKDVWDKFDEHKFDEEDGSIKDNVKFIWNIKNDWKYFYKTSAFGEVANEDGFNNLNVELKKKIKTYYETYKNDEVAGVALTQSQKDYKNFININNDNNSIKDFYEGYYQVLSWIMIFVCFLEFLFIMNEYIKTSKFHEGEADAFVSVFMSYKLQSVTNCQIFLNVLDVIIIAIGWLCVSLKTFYT